jgi:hypothetical protein
MCDLGIGTHIPINISLSRKLDIRILKQGEKKEIRKQLI